jgi:hypothetical protein
MNSSHPSQTAEATTTTRMKITDVVVNKDIQGPVMQVIDIERKKDRLRQDNKIMGIRTGWFNPLGEYQSALFDTRTLRLATAEERKVGFTSAGLL